VLLHVGNEGWFRSAIVHRMLWAMSAARALEYGLPLVRVAVNGRSGVFDPSRDLGWAHGGAASGPVVVEETLVRPRPSHTLYGTLYGLVRRRFSGTYARH
jgi:apolipoprotein N-acyltransferase